MTSIADRLPARRALLGPAARTLLAGGTLVVLGESLRFGAVVAALGFLFDCCLLVLRSAVADYADHAAIGALVLAGTGALLVAGTTLPWVLAGSLVGGWFLLDGVQRCRYGVERGTVVRPFSHDGGPVSGLFRALAGRLLSPVRLPVEGR